MVVLLDEHPWSSHHNYIGARVDSWVTTDFAWSMMHQERDRAIAQYGQWMGESLRGASSAYTDELNPNDTRILGCDAFVAGVQGLAWRPKSRKTLEQLMDEACLMYGVSPNQLFALDRNRHVAQARAWIAHQACALQIASIASVATRFNRDESTLRKSMLRYFESR